MVASIRARLVLVFSTTLFTFMGMAAMAALTTIARDIVVKPRPFVDNVQVAFSAVQTGRQPALIPKLSFSKYRREYEALQQRWATEDAVEQQQQPDSTHADNADGDPLPSYDEAANDFGHRGGPGAIAKANHLVEKILVGAVNRLAALPLVGPLLEGRMLRRTASRETAGARQRRAEDTLGYSITSSPYVDSHTDALAENCYPIEAEAAGMQEQLERFHPQLLIFHCECDAMAVFLSADVDLKPLWDWNTKAIYISFLARYTTDKTTMNEVVFLDAIVRDVALPWSLRHIGGTTPETRDPSEEAAYRAFLESVRHPVHDANGAVIDHIGKKVHFTRAAKYGVTDLHAHTLAGAEVQVLMRYQVMSYSGWAPLKEVDAGKTGSNVLRPSRASFTS